MTAFYRWFWRLGPGNPLALRIVQGGSRRTRDLWVRTLYLGLLVFIVIVTMLSASNLGEVSLNELARIGSALFRTIAYGQVLGVCLLAPIFMAGAINQEQSGETFDILLTTPLSNLQIVLGSLLGRLFFVLALLASGLPLFSPLLVFGGVPVRSIFVAYEVAGLTALMVGSVAVTIAVLRKGGRKAVYLFVIVVAGYLIALYGIDLLLRAMQTPTSPLGAGRTTALTPLHPLLVLESYVNLANYRPPTTDELAGHNALVRFYLSHPLGAFAAMTLAASSAMLGYCALRLRALGEGEPTRLWAWTLGRCFPSRERRRPPRAVWHDAIAWREAHTRGSRLGAYLGRGLFVLAGLAAVVVLLIAYHRGSIRQLPGMSGPGLAMSDVQAFHSILMLMLWVEIASVVMVAIYLSASSVSREREDGTLDLLLTTPVTPRQYVWGKVRGLVSFLTLLLATPVLTLVLVSAYVLLGLAFHWPQVQPDAIVTTGHGQTSSVATLLILPEAALLLPLTLVPFVALCVAVGMTWSLKARGVMGAVVPTLAIIALLVLILGFCGFFASASIPLVGPAINAFSPVTNLFMLISPWNETVYQFGQTPGPIRFAIALSACFAGLVYSLLVWMMIQSMVRSFDHTVRRLTGQAV